MVKALSWTMSTGTRDPEAKWSVYSHLMSKYRLDLMSKISPILYISNMSALNVSGLVVGSKLILTLLGQLIFV